MGAPEREPGAYNDSKPYSVTITRTFEIAVTETTLAQYRTALPVGDAQLKTCGTVQDCPAVHVSWADAARYCNAVSEQRKAEQCYAFNGDAVLWSTGLACTGFRLPTEAEWEYAARAGNLSLRYGAPSDIGWYDENANLSIHGVKFKRANAWGLHDMLGGVSEWVWDWYAEYPARDEVDPVGPANGQNRVFRGGSWRYTAEEATFGWRSAYGPANQVEFIGFRCARTLPN